jgi:SpoVK/Ycf46/Vps4 family AAA+-type ATPase
MVYYDVKFKFELEKSKKSQRDKVKDAFFSVNRAFYEEGPTCKMLIYNHEGNIANAILCFPQKDYSLTLAKTEALSFVLTRAEKVNDVSFFGGAEEISLKVAINKIEKSITNHYFIRSAVRIAGVFCDASYWHHGIDFEEIIFSHARFDYSKALNKAKDILADKSFTEELNRIYSPLNKKKFYGNPVHYVINASSKETAKDMLQLLSMSLYENKRLVSSRVTYVKDVKHCDDDFENLCENSYGAIVAVEFNGETDSKNNYARDAEWKAEMLIDKISDFCGETLFVFVNIGKTSKICKSIMEELTKNIDLSFIEICEGKGNLKEAKKYLNQLLKENKVKYAKGDVTLPKQDEYSVFDVVTVFKKIRKSSIKNTIYKSYKDIKTVKVEAPKSLSNSYDKLQDMVGLDEIKSIIDQIISAQKINKIRKDKGLSVADTAKHMIFTGNPGSAKTTVARLLANILYDEHIIGRNIFVECGRQDLVGKYVGWTAKRVEEQFIKARGGVLFIDEAYSLVDESNSFGDEAINTIVQQMENHRDDVIVIFAGYPDKMQAFLEKNEGLRSRIAFHIDFPDYNGDELCEILKLMTKEKGYILEDEAVEKCREIFNIACQNEEFGNGRFVRNVLEQAIIKQSARICNEYNNQDLDEKELSKLSSSDFDINAAETYKAPEKIAIGF